MPLMKCWAVSETKKQVSTFHPKFVGPDKASRCGLHNEAQQAKTCYIQYL